MTSNFNLIRTLGFLLVASTSFACGQKQMLPAHYDVTAATSSGFVLSTEVVNVKNIPTKALAAGENFLVQPVGGIPPYTFTVLNSTGGQIKSNLQAAIFTAGSVSGHVQLEVSDVYGAGVTVDLDVDASKHADTTLSLNGAPQEVTPGGLLALNAIGGTAPYTYTVVSPTDVYYGGYFAGSVFHAPAQPMRVIVQVKDSAGHQLLTMISVSP